MLTQPVAVGLHYTPTAIGTYTFTTHFPEQWANGTGFGGSYSNLYLASDSAPVTTDSSRGSNTQELLIIRFLQDLGRRPINAENKGWWKISGNWLMKSYDSAEEVSV